MKYLCLIYLDENQPAAMEANEGDMRGAHLVAAAALEPVQGGACVRVRQGRAMVSEAPHVRGAEVVAGFCLISARDLNEAIQVASDIPAASRGSVEVRPCRDLEIQLPR